MHKYKVTSLGNLQKSGSTFGAYLLSGLHTGYTTCQPHGLEVWTGPDRFTRFRPTPKPRTGLWVRFTEVQVQTKVWNQTAASLVRLKAQL